MVSHRGQDDWMTCERKGNSFCGILEQDIKDGGERMWSFNKRQISISTRICDDCRRNLIYSIPANQLFTLHPTLHRGCSTSKEVHSFQKHLLYWEVIWLTRNMKG